MSSTTRYFDAPALDVNADNFLSAIDGLIVINFINDGGYSQGPFLMAAGGDPPPIVKPEDVQVDVHVEIVDANGQPVKSVRVGDQFNLQVSLLLTAPEGVEPFAAFADVRFSGDLVAPIHDKADVGLQWSNVLADQIDEGGRILYDGTSGASSSLMFSKTFTATKAGIAIFEADAAEDYGNDILVTWLNTPVPLSQVTFGSAKLEIKGKSG